MGLLSNRVVVETVECRSAICCGIGLLLKRGYRRIGVIVESEVLSNRGNVEPGYCGIRACFLLKRFIVESGECRTGGMLKRLFVVELFYRGIGGLSNRSNDLPDPTI